MPTVTLTLDELDKLRNEVIENKKNNELLKEELVKVKAEKRVMKIITYPAPEQISFNINKYKLVNRIKSYYDNRRYKSSESLWGDEISIPMEDCVTPFIKESTKALPVEFINFDDVKQELRKEIEDRVSEEIGVLRSKNNSFQSKLAEQSEEYAKNLIKVHKEHNDKVNNLQEEIKLLQEREEKQGLENTISALKKKNQELEKELLKLTNQKWYQKTILYKFLNRK